MSQRTIYVCDRCNKQSESVSAEELRIRWASIRKGNCFHSDLCDECTSLLEKFLRPEPAIKS